VARLFGTNIDLGLNELQNAKLQILSSDPGSPVEGQLWYNSTSKTLKFRTNTATVILGRLDQISAPTAAVIFNGQQATSLLVELLASDPGSPADGRIWMNTTTNVLKFRANGITYGLGRLDQLNAPTADVALNSHKITGLLDGTADTDAATVGQVNAIARGMDWKASVRAATTANGTLATAFANGSVIDGVTLVTGDRILLKNQTTGADNGIYTVNASGAPTRATDADASAEVTAGMTVWVEEGTTNGDKSFTLTTDNPITLGTTSLTFAQSGSAPASAGSVAKFSASIGDGSTLNYVVTHGLGTKDVVVQVWDNSTFDQVEADIDHTTTTTITVGFTVAPTTNQYRVVVLG
jgi:hypothetical protein